MLSIPNLTEAYVPWLLQANLFLLGLFFILVIWNGRYGSPLLGVISRWLRWAIFAIAVGTLAFAFQWIDRPLPALILAAFVAFGLFETLRNWFITGQISQSTMAFFHHYQSIDTGDEWPAQGRVLGIKSWIRRRGFAFAGAVQANLSDELRVRGSVYHDQARRIRLHVTFWPQGNGQFLPSLSLLSITGDGTRVITDNTFIPFGGFFPEDCEVRREPLIRSPERLFVIHERRLKARGLLVQTLDSDPVHDLNKLHGQLEMVNVELGFMLPRQLREDGKLTWEGRYRLWREMWTLEYLGLASRYRD